MPLINITKLKIATTFMETLMKLRIAKEQTQKKLISCKNWKEVSTENSHPF